MADQVHVPGIGATDKKWVYAGVAVALGIAGYAWVRKRSATSSAAASPDAQTLADIGAMGYMGTPGVSSSAPISVTNDNAQITTNAQWMQFALQQLQTYSGWDQGAVTTALGKWLAHQPLTDTEVLIVQSAKGIAGDPPVGGPYPVVHAQPTPSPSGPPPFEAPPLLPGEKRPQFYHPVVDETTGYAPVTVGAEWWTNNIKRLAYAFGYTDPYAVWSDPKNAALRAKYGNTLPAQLDPGDIVYAKYNPNANWSQLFPAGSEYSPDPYLDAVRRGIVAPY